MPQRRVAQQAPAPQQTRAMHPAEAPPPQAHKSGKGWIRRHWLMAVFTVVGMVAASAGLATVLIRHDLTSTPTALARDIQFQTGTGYTVINTAGFATITLSGTGASASISLDGVAGAALTSLPQVLKIKNNGASAHSITFARSTGVTDLDSAIDDFIVVVENAGVPELTWDAADSAASSAYSLPAGATRDITLNLRIADGTAAGAIGSAFAIQVSYAP